MGVAHINKFLVHAYIILSIQVGPHWPVSCRRIFIRCLTHTQSHGKKRTVGSAVVQAVASEKPKP